MNDEPEIIFDVRGAVGHVHLNLPKSFNALTQHMCVAMRQQLIDWATDDAVAACVVTAAGDRAFCAGGDIRAIYDTRLEQNGLAVRPFFQGEYRLDHAVYHFPKPYVALMDGIVMGGGAGISVHGSHRVVSEKTMYAMPECGIGLFPDVGATLFLNAAPGAVGMYMGLTGARLKAADLLYTGIATHHVPTDRMSDLADALFAADLGSDAGAVIDDVLAGVATDPGPAPIAEHREVIDHAFSADTVEGILERLQAADGYFAIEAADTLDEKCPTSLKTTHEQLSQGKGLDFDEAIRREYRMVCEIIEHEDFYEGIRAAVVDKDRAPKWKPGSLADVSAEAVAAHFRHLGDDELRFD